MSFAHRSLRYVQLIAYRGDGVRRKGFSIINTICYIREWFSGKRESVSIIAAAAFDHVMPCTWALPPGVRCNAYVFETWFGTALLPAVPAGYTIIMDNAPWHRRAILRAMAHAVGVNVIFLPAYSPELAWIELAFGWTKRHLKNQDMTLPQLVGSCMQSLAAIPAVAVKGFVRHAGYWYS